MILLVQYPRLFSIGTFTKTGPTRQQASINMCLCVVLCYDIINHRYIFRALSDTYMYHYRYMRVPYSVVCSLFPICAL